MKLLLKFLILLIFSSSLVAREVCKKFELPEEVNKSELEKLNQMIPNSESGILNQVRFISEAKPKIERVDVEFNYGLHLYYSIDDCSGRRNYIFTKQNGNWELESTIFVGAPRACPQTNSSSCTFLQGRPLASLGQ